MKEFAPQGANSFLEELTMIGKGGRKETGRVVPLVSVKMSNQVNMIVMIVFHYFQKISQSMKRRSTSR